MSLISAPTQSSVWLLVWQLESAADAADAAQACGRVIAPAHDRDVTSSRSTEHRRASTRTAESAPSSTPSSGLLDGATLAHCRGRPHLFWRGLQGRRRPPAPVHRGLSIAHCAQSAGALAHPKAGGRSAGSSLSARSSAQAAALAHHAQGARARAPRRPADELQPTVHDAATVETAKRPLRHRAALRAAWQCTASLRQDLERASERVQLGVRQSVGD